MNIMYILNDVNFIGGASLSLLDTIKGIQGSINPVVIIPAHGIVEESLNERKIKYYIVSFENGYGERQMCTCEWADINFKNNFEAALQLQPIISREKIQLIHINSSVSNVGAMAALIANIPYVWHLREMPTEQYNYEFWDKQFKISLFQGADSLITISDCVKEHYIQQYEVDSVRIYDGVDIDKYKRTLDVERFSEKTKNFLLAGALIPAKGQLDAIKAIKELVNQNIKNISLNIVGDGTQRYVWVLEQYIKKNELNEFVHIYPFQKDLTLFRKESAFSITSSIMEALGRVTIEAMLAGNVVIGADTGGTKELIGLGNERGYLYEQGNHIALAEVMKQAIRNENGKNQEYLVKAQKFAEDTFNLSAYIMQIQVLYEQILCADTEKQRKRRQELLQSIQKRYESMHGLPIKREENVEIRVEKKYRKMFYASMQWLYIKQKKYNVEKYFIQRNMKEIAIYGMGYLGRFLYDELEEGIVNVKYAIDRNPDEIDKIIRIISPNEILEKVDAVVVTAVMDYEEIKDEVRKRLTVPIISLEEILFESARN